MIFCQLVTRKYLQHHFVFEVHPKPYDSTTWKCILNSIDVLIKGIRWIIGNGQSVKLWTYNWVYYLVLINILPNHSIDTNQ